MPGSFEVETVEAAPIASRPSAEGSSFLELSGGQLGASVIRGSDKEPEAGRLSLLQAVIVLFCTCFGAGIALVAWYPKLVGSVGFVVILALVGTTATLAERAIMVTALEIGGSTFLELCVSLPNWMGLLTQVSAVAWGLCIVGLYTLFLFSAVSTQLFGGGGGNFLYLGVGIAVFAVTTPTSFSGTTAKVVNNVNLCTTWVVIITSIVKGFAVISSGSSPEEEVKEFTVWRPVGFVQVTVLLAGAMVQCSSMPQLSFEISTPLRERASLIVPGTVAIIQAIVFLIVGLCGYFALGNAVTGDVFKTYATVKQQADGQCSCIGGANIRCDDAGSCNCNDWMIVVLQCGIALLMYLSCPLVQLPAKTTLWAFIARARGLDNSGGLSSAPATTRHGLNFVLVAGTTCMPMLLGTEGYMSLLTALASTAANWTNLFLPGFVLLFARVLPARRRSDPYIRDALVCAWILLLASVCLVSSLHKMLTASEPETLVSQPVCPQ